MPYSYYPGVQTGAPSSSSVVVGMPGPASVSVGRSGTPPFKPFNVVTSFFNTEPALSVTMTVKATVAAPFGTVGTLGVTLNNIIATVPAAFGTTGTLSSSGPTTKPLTSFVTNSSLSAVVREGRAVETPFIGLGTLSAVRSVV